MTPEERVRRCILWNKIERLLFSPASVADKMQWCHLYLMSLAKLWETEPFAIQGPAFPRNSLNTPIPGFSIFYDLSRWDNIRQCSSLRMSFEGIEFASHDIDHAYHDRNSLSDPHPTGVLSYYPRIATRRDELTYDIQWVLDRYLLHPCAHVHPLPEIAGYMGPIIEALRDVLHEVRFGLGITNPFAALFQFRINLPVRETPEDTQTLKETERDRIAHLVFDAILSRPPLHTIPPGRLFGIK